MEGINPTTFAGRPISAIARIAPMTAAPPDMSYFISSMPTAGLIETPPVSNVRPFPTNATKGSFAFPPRCRRTMKRGSRSEP